MAGDGVRCFGCPLNVTIPFASFNGDAAPRAQAVRLYGEAAPPAAVRGFACNQSSGVSFAWSGEVIDSGETIPLGFANQAYGKTLLLPPLSVPAGVVSRFTLRVCYTENPLETLCGKAGRAFQAVASPLAVAVSGGNTLVGKGAITLDASGSRDPDGEPGPLNFEWQCSPPAGLASASGGCLSADGATDLGRFLGTAPALPGLQLRGAPPPGANYTLTVTAQKGFRSATARVWLVVQSGVTLPVIALQQLAQPKVNPTQKVVLRATVASDAPPSSLHTEWSAVSAPAGFDLSAAGVAGTPLTSTSLVLNPGALPPRSTVVLRLSVSDAGGATSADIAVPVAGTPRGLGGPGTLGAIRVSPRTGFGLDTPFSFAAVGWTDDDLPLSYAFYFFVPGVPNAREVALGDSRPQSAVAGVLLPAGDPAGDHVVSVFVVVMNAFGASARSEPVNVTVTWDPKLLEDPAAQAALVAKQAADARTMVLTGSPDGAMSTVTGVSALLNTGTATGARRRALLGGAARRRTLLADAAANGGGAGDPTPEQQARAGQREDLLGLLVDVTSITVPTSQALESIAGAVAAVAAAPEELTQGAQTSALAALGAVATGGDALGGGAANSTAAGLSSVAIAASAATTPGGRRRMLRLQPSVPPRGPPPASSAADTAGRAPPPPPPSGFAVRGPSHAAAAARKRSLLDASGQSRAPAGAPPVMSGGLKPPRVLLLNDAAPGSPAILPVSPAGAPPIIAAQSSPAATAPPPPSTGPPDASNRRRLAAAPRPPSSPPPPPPRPSSPAPPVPRAPDAPVPAVAALVQVVGVIDNLAGSLQSGFSVAGEAPATLSSDAITMQVQLDAPSPDSRLFSQGFAAPGAAFQPLPKDLFAAAAPPADNAPAAAAAPAAVQTQFLALDFNPWAGSAASAAASGGAASAAAAVPAASLAGSLTRLKFSGADGSEVSVQNRSAPIRFSMPAAPVPAGSGAVCSFWDAEAAAFSTEGCAALPRPLPPGHTVEWIDLPANASALAQLVGTEPSFASASSCKAVPDAEYVHFFSATGPAAAAQQVGVAWELTGPLACNCTVTVLSCAEQSAAAERARRSALASGLSAAAADAAANATLRRIFVSPLDALLIPAVTCAAGDSSTVMLVFYGRQCALGRNPASSPSAAAAGAAPMTDGNSLAASSSGPPAVNSTVAASAHGNGTAPSPTSYCFWDAVKQARCHPLPAYCAEEGREYLVSAAGAPQRHPHP